MDTGRIQIFQFSNADYSKFSFGNADLRKM